MKLIHVVIIFAALFYQQYRVLSLENELRCLRQKADADAYELVAARSQVHSCTIEVEKDKKSTVKNFKVRGGSR